MSGYTIRNLPGLFDPVTGALVGHIDMNGREQLDAVSGNLPGGGSANQVLAKSSDGTTNVWVDAPSTTPPDGSITTPKIAARAVGASQLAAATSKTYLGRSSAGTGDVEQVPVSTVRADLSIDQVSNTSDANKPVSTAQQAALDAKVSLLGAVDLGTATTATITAGAHANRPVKANPSSSATYTFATTGTPAEQDTVVITNNGTATIVMSGVVVGTGFSANIPPNTAGGAVYSGGSWKSWVVNPAGASAPASISGDNHTGGVMTCTPASGYSGSFQWTRDGTNIAGQTASTHTMVSADETHTIACKFGTDPAFTTNSVTGLAAADTTAPAPSGAPHVDNGTATIVRQNFGEALVTNGIAAGDCTVTGKTVSSVAISGTELQITVSAAFVNGDTSTLSVAANKLKDAAGNLCAAITTSAITNNVPPAITTSKVRSSGTNKGANVSESGDGTAGWNYNNGAGVSNVFLGTIISLVSDTSLQAGAGYLQFSIGTLSNGSGGDEWDCYFDLSTDPTPTGPYSTNSYSHPVAHCAIHSTSGAFDPYTTLDSTGTVISVTPASNDLIRLERDASNVVRLRVSKDSGTTWTNAITYPGTVTGNLYFHANTTIRYSLNNLVGGNFA